jgi:cold shock CspA family protein
MPSSSPSSSHVGPSKPVYAGKQARGRIKSLTRGQGSGVISTSSGDVFFHKADFRGTFWDLNVGDQVAFELLNDTISGPRAQNVRLAPLRKAR